MVSRLASSSACFIAVAAAAVMAFGPLSPAGAKKEVENRILVGGDAGFGFTTHSAQCRTHRGKLVFFQTPDMLRSDESQHPEITGWLQEGAWYFDLHSPNERYFHSDNARGVVPKQEPHGWRIDLHKVRLDERITLHIAHAEVSGIVTCTYIEELPD